jgi:hypothetical protein
VIEPRPVTNGVERRLEGRPSRRRQWFFTFGMPGRQRRAFEQKRPGFVGAEFGGQRSEPLPAL